jgi:hypothetical protein
METARNDCDRGSSITEAKSMDWIFDALASAWLPLECRDDELTAEFNRSGHGPDGSWPYYADPNGTIPITTADMALMGGTRKFWYSTKEWHVAHCNFTGARKFRMKKTGRLVEKRDDQMGHNIYCNGVVMDGVQMDSITVHAGVSLNSAA